MDFYRLKTNNPSKFHNESNVNQEIDKIKNDHGDLGSISNQNILNSF